ncbi:isopentenyl-diphosphate delta-isomerase I [Micractinium conductrix]|uniref:isopentenyl-diphosphate Delta-isomerase n=1 Tax=Micractinium conductrix TaxID=554055 RepID=A0A2P6VM58_9CHLO|nr:isopentenyl-diphosphate delta-isomerase I [Micractinium conductrix]|eukprot:PSC75135.1 isopentenyl-diphosphate delta-isomerase I [Micractinium conductrix]
MTVPQRPQGDGLAQQQQQRQGVATWDGNASQEELMLKDECIVVDEGDNITGHASKYQAHRFEDGQPRGQLHRAFSVFLFNSQNKLLLQQRAASKITFPKVWTNTCCSHPLHGYTPTEVDNAADIAAGTVPGAKRAAVRKLLHELGIPSAQLPLDKFKYLTRLHYCAADTGTWGLQAEWGEHELDYILFVKADVSVEPNAEEVMDTKYVSMQELRQMMHPGSGLLWSPWFRIIAENFLEKWWAELDATLTTDAHVDTATIHRIMA